MELERNIMKKVKSLKDLANLMESLGATKDEEPGFTSWTLDCGPGRQAPSSKRQAASATKQTQLQHIYQNQKENDS
jgi:hypothetical protein